MRRLFIAVDLSIPVVERLARLQHDLDEQIEERFDGDLRLRTVDAENIHITLKFLGDTEPALVPVIIDVLRRLCEPLFPFQVECRQVGVFPKPTRPRIIWAGLDEQGAEVLGLLQKNIEQDLAAIGIDEDNRAFSPHVTVARVKTRSPHSFEALLERYDGVSFGESFIKDMVLYESHLDQQGPRYEVVERLKLGSS